VVEDPKVVTDTAVVSKTISLENNPNVVTTNSSENGVATSGALDELPSSPSSSKIIEAVNSPEKSSTEDALESQQINDQLENNSLSENSDQISLSTAQTASEASSADEYLLKLDIKSECDTSAVIPEQTLTKIIVTTAKTVIKNVISGLNRLINT